MSPFLPVPDEKEWWPICPTSKTSDFAIFFAMNYVLIGFAASAVVSIGMLYLVHGLGFSLAGVVSPEWWGLFPVLGMIGVVLVVHELLHAVFANWRLVRFTLDTQHGSIAAQLGGVMGKHQFILCALAPTFASTLVAMPAALYFNNPYLMAAALINLGLAGVDWSAAIKVALLVQSDRVYSDGVTLYVPRIIV